METRPQLTSLAQCMHIIRPVKDALDVLNGKWKLPILISLRFGIKRFKELSTDLGAITDSILAKELKELEGYKLIERKVHSSFPPHVEYAITEHGLSLKDVIIALEAWGYTHRMRVFGKK